MDADTEIIIDEWLRLSRDCPLCIQISYSDKALSWVKDNVLHVLPAAAGERILFDLCQRHQIKV